MIEAHALHKRYGRLLAVDGISFKVEPGEVLGFLGPNGAGKSTTMKMIAGFLAPTAGTAMRSLSVKSAMVFTRGSFDTR